VLPGCRPTFFKKSRLACVWCSGSNCLSDLAYRQLEWMMGANRTFVGSEPWSGGKWPMFLLQPIAPLMLVHFSWKPVVVGSIALNVLWALLVRYNYVSVRAACFGVQFVRLKWIASPLAAYHLYSRGEKTSAAIALFWPLVILFIGAVPTVQIGKIQQMFMMRLGYATRGPG